MIKKGASERSGSREGSIDESVGIAQNRRCGDDGTHHRTDFTEIIDVIQVPIWKKAGEKMIKYDQLWKTMQKKGVTQYDLYTYHNVNRSQLDRLRKNKNVQTNTIDRLCNILHCNVEDIMEHIEDDNLF